MGERILQPHSSASCHVQCTHGAFLWDCNSHGGLDFCDEDTQMPAAFYGPWKNHGRWVPSLASCQLGGCENVFESVTGNLTGGYGRVGLFDCGIHVLGHNQMKNDGVGGGCALVEKASYGYGAVPFWEGTTDKSPGLMASNDEIVAPVALPSTELVWELEAVPFLWIPLNYKVPLLYSPGHLFGF